ncbi:MAG: ribulose-phosphate 3-epimerase, partial [Chloroflexi bacterium]|nr:ribulose-phosphate 3-epimerase [Chloroflexota bacterium]
HVEACTHSHRLLEAIRAAGAKASVGLNPGSPVALVEELLPFVDMVNVLSVNPGFSGQSFIPTMLDKVRRLRAMLDGLGSKAELEIDGGMSEKTAPSAVAAGARVLVAGSAVFNPRESITDAIARLRRAVEGGRGG